MIICCGAAGYYAGSECFDVLRKTNEFLSLSPRFNAGTVETIIAHPFLGRECLHPIKIVKTTQPSNLLAVTTLSVALASLFLLGAYAIPVVSIQAMLIIMSARIVFKNLSYLFHCLKDHESEYHQAAMLQSCSKERLEIDTSSNLQGLPKFTGKIIQLYTDYPFWPSQPIRCPSEEHHQKTRFPYPSFPDGIRAWLFPISEA